MENTLEMSFNKITIVGNLGRDPELRYTPQGNAVCNISVASSEKRRDKTGDMQDVTTWFRITLWGKQAENASKYLTKGSPVYIEGRLRVEEWSDRDGKNRYTLEVNATDMQFIGSSRGGDDYSGGGTAPDFNDDAPARSGGVGDFSGQPNDDDIPF
jgi:single-strand DNA-binding protein